MRPTLTLLALLAPAVACAAPITWRPAFELVTDADIDLSFGPVVYAVNGGDNTGNEPFMLAPQPAIRTVTVGATAIPFEGIEGRYGSGSTFASSAFGDAIDHLAGGFENVTFSTTASRTTPIPQVTYDRGAADIDANSLPDTRTYDISTGNADLDAILASQVFFDGRGIGSSALNISLNNLVPGQQYQLQLFGPASQPPSRVSQATVDDGVGNSATGLAGLLDLDGDTIAHVTSLIGTFTADATSQAVNVVLAADRNSGISGLVLTTNVPEPSTAILTAVAVAGGVARRRR